MRQARRSCSKCNMPSLPRRVNMKHSIILCSAQTKIQFITMNLQICKQIYGIKLWFCEKVKALFKKIWRPMRLSVRQYQRMERDPSAISSLWQLFKIAKAHSIDIKELLDID